MFGQQSLDLAIGYRRNIVAAVSVSFCLMAAIERMHLSATSVKYAWNGGVFILFDQCPLPTTYAYTTRLDSSKFVWAKILRIGNHDTIDLLQSDYFVIAFLSSELITCTVTETRAHAASIEWEPDSAG